MGVRQVAVLPAFVLLVVGCAQGGDNEASALPTAVSTTSSSSPTAAKPTPRPSTPAATRTTSPTPTRLTPTPAPTRPTVAATTRAPAPRPTTPRPVATTRPPATGTMQLSISGFAFDPQTFTVPRGTTVRVTNHDLQEHTWTAKNKMWDSGDLGLNESYSYRLMTTGVFDFVCTPHAQSMTGRVTVT